ncbi:hypothetical protein C7M84_013280 [Penaeus vannamei]|uniref:Uncharacterized protein n=1 Tax=Penaeus vannamei TaxID=6689 RepID=A0A423SWQ5_PENVA|nr:hypothetical protein C7M84_013280 [Penaeus vannamei]
MTHDFFSLDSSLLLSRRGRMLVTMATGEDVCGRRQGSVSQFQSPHYHLFVSHSAPSTPLFSLSPHSSHPLFPALPHYLSLPLPCIRLSLVLPWLLPHSLLPLLLFFCTPSIRHGTSFISGIDLSLLSTCRLSLLSLLTFPSLSLYPLSHHLHPQNLSFFPLSLALHLLSLLLHSSPLSISLISTLLSLVLIHSPTRLSLARFTFLNSIPSSIPPPLFLFSSPLTFFLFCSNSSSIPNPSLSLISLRASPLSPLVCFLSLSPLSLSSLSVSSSLSLSRSLSLVCSRLLSRLLSLLYLSLYLLFLSLSLLSFLLSRNISLSSPLPVHIRNLTLSFSPTQAPFSLSSRSPALHSQLPLSLHLFSRPFWSSPHSV